MPIRHGSTRIMTPVEPGVIALTYTDQWSAFDRGPSPQLISRIGAARCACAVRSFKLARAANVPTHFVRQADEVTIHVKEFEVPGQPLLSGKSHGRVLPLEFINRSRVAGSLLRRLRDGTIKPEELGFPMGAEVPEWEKLPRPKMECTTKFEPMDRHISNEEAMQLAGLNEDQWVEAWDLIVETISMLDAGFNRVGYYRLDGKMELGMTNEGQIVAVDVFGTPDEDRIVNVQTKNLHCKDIIRNYLEQHEWYEKLKKAKKKFPDDKSKWPPYPELPAQLVQEVQKRYAELTLYYAGINVLR